MPTGTMRCSADIITGWSPQRERYVWLLINIACLVASACLIVLICLGPESKGDRFARQCYLFYNLATSVVWCTEVGLSFLEQSESGQSLPKREKMEGYAELALAFYFTLDSAIVLIRWKMKRNHTNSMMLDLIVNLFAYLYATAKIERNSSHLWKKGGYRDIDTYGDREAMDSTISTNAMSNSTA